jgi:hypothetical protein
MNATWEAPCKSMDSPPEVSRQMIAKQMEIVVIASPLRGLELLC